MIFINIGIDIGGKHVGMGIVDSQGNIIKKEIDLKPLLLAATNTVYKTKGMTL